MNAISSELIDVYGLWYHPWWTTLKFYIFLNIALFLLIWLLVRIIKKWWRGKIRLSIDLIALQDLYRVQVQTYISEESIHEAYFKVTMILKTYLSARYHIHLLDKTDQEIAMQLHGVVPEELEALLKEFFERSFQIKFAYDFVSEPMLKDDIVFAQKVIQATSVEIVQAGQS